MPDRADAHVGSLTLVGSPFQSVPELKRIAVSPLRACSIALRACIICQPSVFSLVIILPPFPTEELREKLFYLRPEDLDHEKAPHQPSDKDLEKIAPRPRVQLCRAIGRRPKQAETANQNCEGNAVQSLHRIFS